ncbi:hypothetical protein CFE70_007027 [Pyrenophora teres f. teres 0-1]
MAILSEYPGLEVAFIVHGQRLEEYDDDDEPLPKTVTKYIEAQPGANVLKGGVYSQQDKESVEHKFFLLN